jgi:8-oxo-dGTP pyrophosphatase MutT (NUDIX family)
MSDLRERLAQRFRAGMARPAPNLFSDPRVDHGQDFKPAAVLVAVTERAEAGILLLHRPETMRAHAGQVALPGGRIDPGENAVQAALREAQEELGIDPALVSVIGEGDLFLTGSGYAITPVLAVVPEDLEILPNPQEVAAWFEAPLDFVMDRRNHLRAEMEWAGARRELVEIVWDEHRIWGVTGAILANLAHRLDWGLDWRG